MKRHKTAVIWDVHGAVPEEFEFQNNLSASRYYTWIEEQLSQKALAILCVTSAMKLHIVEKYKVPSSRCIILPIIPDIGKLNVLSRRTSRFAYAGGNQVWQKISDMLSAIARTPVEGHFYFFVPNPSDFEGQWRINALAGPRKRMIVETGSPADIRRELSSMGFGFCLRGDHVLNKVAFPTKLAEYVAAGVVPILSHADIGDILSDGLRYVPLSKFIAGELPSEAERQLMADFNYGLLEQWRSRMSNGAGALNHCLKSKP